MELAPTAELLDSVFHGSDVARPEYLRWLYRDSPFGEVIEANLDDAQGRAGHYALVPIALARDGEPLAGALSLNTAVHERARGGGTFVRLASEAIESAAQLGVRSVVGVANANSTPGFLRRLQFELLGPLPASVLLPRPGSAEGIESEWNDPTVPGVHGLAADSGRLLAPPVRGAARLWSETTLRWRLARPRGRYALHRGEDLLAVSCLQRRRGMRVAVLLKVFAAEALAPGRRRALVRAACRFHRAPLALHVGLNRNASFKGVSLPGPLRDSPLNLIHRSLENPPRPGAIVDFEFLDFDAF